MSTISKPKTGYDSFRQKVKDSETSSPIRVTLHTATGGTIYLHHPFRAVDIEPRTWASLQYFLVYPNGEIMIRNKSRHYVPCRNLTPQQIGRVRAAARRAVAWIK